MNIEMWEILTQRLLKGFFMKFIMQCNSIFSCPSRRSQFMTWIKNKDVGVVAELLLLPDGYFPTLNTGFPKALKKAPSQQAIPESSAYSPPGFPEWDVSLLVGVGDILARLDVGYVRSYWNNKESSLEICRFWCISDHHTRFWVMFTRPLLNQRLW